MNYTSTRNSKRTATLSRALREGIAPDGGLYVPQALPAIAANALDGRAELDAVVPSLLAPFFDGDALARALPAIAAEAFGFPAPLRLVQAGAEPLSLLELFHGPTAAFKDFGACFLAACLARIPPSDSRPLTVLVATSGDTGGAVAAAFHRRPGFRVVLLYPAGRISPVQEHQLTCWGDNVRSFAVHGSFDDCQRLVKQSFADERLRQALALTSANSINIGRLLPQLTLFASAALRIRHIEGGRTNFVIPSGNLGLATACVWAREMGLPIGEIVLAHNANRTVPDYLADGQWRPRASIATLASAMDVGDPSNMERLLVLYRDHAALAARLQAVSIDDAAIRDSIQGEFSRSGLVLCPHTAAGAAAYRALPKQDQRPGHWIVVATAHPAKFPEVVEPLIGRKVDTPPALVRLLDRPSVHEPIDVEFRELSERLLAASAQ
ncbi:MAG: threonine synthase [Steroidobacteraceae bacterium]